MIGFKRRDWKHAYKTEISYLRELAIMGCLLSLVMGSLAFMAGSDEVFPPGPTAAVEPQRTAAAQAPLPAVPHTPEPAATESAQKADPQPIAPVVAEPQTAAEPQKTPEALEDEKWDGIDPLATPEVFDRYDALDKLGGVLAHLPSDKPTHRRETPAPVPQLSVVIDKGAHRLTVFRGGRKLREFGVAVGRNVGDKQRTGDMRTPEGMFPVEQIHNASYWVHDFGDGNGIIEGAYGPLFIRLHTPPWKGIGIHGTHDPDSIGSNATEGCVRMKNEELIDFAEMIDIGTPVTILPN